MLLVLTLIISSCVSDIESNETTVPEAPSEAVTSEDVTSPPEDTSEKVTTDIITEEELTIEDITTEEITTAEVTTAEVATAEVTTEEVTTKEVTTEDAATEEVTAPPVPHEHVWGAWRVIKASGCTLAGNESRECACGETESRDIPSLGGHIDGRWITVTKATCTEKGYRERICSRCTLVILTESIPEKGHSGELRETIKASCISDGRKDNVCIDCGKLLSAETVKAYGHTEGRTVTEKEASCTSEGLRHTICSVCTAIFRSEIIEPTGHSPGSRTVVQEVSCTADGLIEYFCDGCGILLSSETVKAYGHTEGRTVTEKEVSCTSDGLRHTICSVCTLILRSETIVSEGHVESGWTVDDELSTEEISVRQKKCIYCGILMAEERIKSLALIEAERVAAAINAVRGDNSFTFAALSDIHVDNVGTGYNQIPTKRSCEFAVRTLSLMERMMKVSAAALLGDYTASGHNYSMSHIISDFEYVRECFGDLGDLPVAWIRGNHEINYYGDSERPTTNEELYEYIDSNSRGLTVDPQNPKGGYGYIDFPENKIRMIFLNTSDVYTEYIFVKGEEAPCIGVSSAQLRWFAETALDLSDKADASEWGILLNSHAPLNYTADTSRFLILLEAYKDGRAGVLSYSLYGKAYSVDYNFTYRGRAEIICSIHGHNHNFKHEKISSSSAVSPWLWRICVPNICAGRENECATSIPSFAQKWGDFDEEGNPLYYTKCHWDDQLGMYIYDEDAGTSYCMITVNRDTKMIYAHYVGTGRDRELSYAE